MDVGGAERVAMNIATPKDMCYEYHIVEVMRGTGAFSDEMLREAKTKGIMVHRSPLPVLFRWHYLNERLCAMLFPLWFVWLWMKYRPQVIHTHTEIPDMAIWWTMNIMPFINSRVVRTIHNTRLWTGINVIGPKVERFMQARRANLAISPNVKAEYTKRFGKDAEMPVIYNGVAPVEKRRYDRIVNGKKNILFAGRFERQKGVSTLCKIVEGLKGDDRYVFHIFGDGTLKSEVETLKAENVFINPPKNGIASIMSSFDYLLMPSEHEGLSILAIEAAMNGLPVMINHVDGLYDVLPPEWPLTVHDNNIDEWLRLFEEILPKIDREGLKREAREYAMEHFSVEQMKKEYESYYSRTDI